METYLNSAAAGLGTAVRAPEQFVERLLDRELLLASPGMPTPEGLRLLQGLTNLAWEVQGVRTPSLIECRARKLGRRSDEPWAG